MVVKKLRSEQLVTFWTCLFDGLLEPDLSSSGASSIVLNHSLKYRGSECSSQVCVVCSVVLSYDAFGALTELRGHPAYESEIV